MAAGGHRYRGRGGERGQASLLFLGLLAALFAGTLALFGLGQALGARSKHQRAADLAAVSAAQVMSGNYTRLFEPAVFENGLPNPHHLSNEQFLALARAAASRGARRNGVAAGRIRVEFPGGGFAPTRVKVETAGEARLRLSNHSRAERIPVRASAAADITPRLDGGLGMPASGSGGGYDGPLAYRMGKPMRPDVAAAFDRMAAAARREAELYLSISSGFRSDAEHQLLWNANPNPKWVAPPGTSLHRWATELDLGPPAAYDWLWRNHRRFGFIRRCAWEPLALRVTVSPQMQAAPGHGPRSAQPARAAVGDTAGAEPSGTVP
jgi:D-alanyl-D-alanine carboxypeptidase/Putative Flp pilus-assembly TadE/G-like